jgi:hypothetical protein
MQGFSIDSTDKSGGLYHQEIIVRTSAINWQQYIRSCEFVDRAKKFTTHLGLLYQLSTVNEEAGTGAPPLQTVNCQLTA